MNAPDGARGMSGAAAAGIAGITYRQLDYWARTDLIRPSIDEARGSGTRRRYSHDDVVKMTLIRTLLDQGIRLETIRDLFRGEPTAPLRPGSILIVNRSEASVVDLIPDTFTGPTLVIPLDPIRNEVANRFAALASNTA